MTDDAPPAGGPAVPPAGEGEPRDYGFAPPGGDLAPPRHGAAEQQPVFGPAAGPAIGAAPGDGGSWPDVLAAAPLPWWRRSRSLVVSGVVAALALIGVLAVVVAVATSSHSLPSSLLGLSRGTGPDAQAAEHAFVQGATQAARGRLVDVSGAVYGDPMGRWLALLTAKPCSACFAYSAAHDVRVARAHGHADARSFPPGPSGGALVCYTEAGPPGSPVVCTWFTSTAVGIAAYSSTEASSVADAAAKTRQIRAAIGR